MLVHADNSFNQSPSVHSLGLAHNMTVPSPGFDQNPLLIEQKKFWGSGVHGLGCNGCNRGISGLTFDGTGLFGTGLFSGDYTTWGIWEVIVGIIGIYAIYSMIHQGKQTKYRLEMGAGRRRKSRAKRLREKAKQLDEQTEGIF